MIENVTSPTNLDIFNRCTEVYNMNELLLTMNIGISIFTFVLLYVLTFYIWKCKNG